LAARLARVSPVRTYQEPLIRETIHGSGPFVMPNRLTLLAIRILRWLPRTARFDAHLDRCAAIEVLHVPYDDRFRPLRLAHVIGAIPLPQFLPGLPNIGCENVEIAGFSDNIVKGETTPVIRDRGNTVERRPQTFH